MNVARTGGQKLLLHRATPSLLLGRRVLLCPPRQVRLLRRMHDGGKFSDDKSGNSSDWAQKLAKSMENTIKNASDKAVSATQEMAQKASQRVAASSQQALESSKKYVGSQMNSIKENVKSQADDLVKQASQSTQEFAKKASQSSQDYLKSSTDQIMKKVSDVNPVAASQKLVKAASDKVVSSSKAAVQKTTDYASSRVNQASERVQSQVTTLSTTLERTLRSALWWLLAAVGVYGIATTLPVEVFRYMTRGGQENKEENSSTKEK